MFDKVCKVCSGCFTSLSRNTRFCSSCLHVKDEHRAMLRKKPRVFSNLKVGAQDSRFWYLMGLLVTDGHIDRGGRAVFITTDRDHALRVAEVFEVEGRFVVYPKKIASSGVECRVVFNKKACDLLKSRGLHENKDQHQVDSSKLSISQKVAFLLGHLDGDGSVYFSPGGNNFRIEFLSRPEPARGLWKLICEVLEIRDLPYREVQRRDRKKLVYIKLSSKRALHLGCKMWSLGLPCLERKRQKWLFWLSLVESCGGRAGKRRRNFLKS